MSKRRSLLTSIFFFLSMAGVPGHAGGQLRTVRLYLDWYPNVEFAGILVAKDRGWYREAGIDLVPVHHGLDIIGAVKAGRADIGMAQGHDLVRQIASGSRLKAFAANYQVSPVCILVGQNSGIKSVGDLKGKTIGIVSPHEYDIYKIMLGSVGLSLKDVRFKKVESLDERTIATAMRSGVIDAVAAWESNWGTTFALLGHNVRVLRADQNGFHFYGIVFFGPTAYVAKNSKLMAAFLKATFRGWREVHKNPDYYARYIVERHFPRSHLILGSGDLTLRQQRIELRLRERYFVEGVGSSRMGFMSEFKWQESIEVARRYGLISKHSSLRSKDLYDGRPLSLLSRGLGR